MIRAAASFIKIWFGTVTGKAETALTRCEPMDSRLPCLTSFLQSSWKRQNRSGVFTPRSLAGEFIPWVARRTLGVRQLEKGLERDRLQNRERGRYQSKHKSEAKGQLFSCLNCSALCFASQEVKVRSEKQTASAYEKLLHFKHVHLQASPMWIISAT